MRGNLPTSCWQQGGGPVATHRGYGSPLRRLTAEVRALVPRTSDAAGRRAARGVGHSLVESVPSTQSCTRKEPLQLVHEHVKRAGLGARRRRVAGPRAIAQRSSPPNIAPRSTSANRAGLYPRRRPRHRGGTRRSHSRPRTSMARRRPSCPRLSAQHDRQGGTKTPPKPTASFPTSPAPSRSCATACGLQSSTGRCTTTSASWYAAPVRRLSNVTCRCSGLSVRSFCCLYAVDPEEILQRRQLEHPPDLMRWFHEYQRRSGRLDLGLDVGQAMDPGRIDERDVRHANRDDMAGLERQNGERIHRDLRCEVHLAHDGDGGAAWCDLLLGGYHLAGPAVEDRIEPTVRDLAELVVPRIAHARALHRLASSRRTR